MRNLHTAMTTFFLADIVAVLETAILRKKKPPLKPRYIIECIFVNTVSLEQLARLLAKKTL